MRTLTKEPLVRCYQVLHEAGCHTEEAGLTASDLAERCDQRYGARHQGYWGKQLQALAEMGYAEKSGRWFKCAPIWVAVAPNEQQ
jgi:hypothetical protein